MTFDQFLPLLIPLIVLQLALMGVGLFDLTRPERSVKGGNKLVWGLLIVFVQFLIQALAIGIATRRMIRVSR